MPGTVLICIRIVCFVKNFDNKASFECRMRSCYFGGSAFCIRVLDPVLQLSDDDSVFF